MIGKPSVAFACILAALALAGCRKPVAEEEAIRPVRAIKVGDLKAIQGREFPGRAKARDEVDLSFRVSGPLVSLPVDVGSKVKKGDVIAAIDPRDFQTALDSAQGNLSRAQADLLAMERGARPEEVEQLKAAVTEAEATYRQALAEHERNAKLLPSGAVSKSEFDMTLARRDRTAAQVKKAKEDLNIGLKGARPEDLEAKRSEIKALEAAVANAKNQLDYAVLKAPFDGSVAARYVDNYQTVQAKQPVVRLLDVSKIEVTIQVPESLISLVPQVKKAVCRFDAFAGREFAGQVTKIGSEASQTTRTYPVTVQVDQPKDVQILPGMAATVRGQPEKGDKGTDGGVIVPPGAVFSADAGQQSYIWVVEEGSQKVTRRAVKTGKLTPVGLAVIEGLKAGEWVVTAGVYSLRENQAVTILQEGSR
ncbi:MAG: efflux RND transporter periplasmic adaptor subunit [Thermoguttaceae bacterium]|jgi:RND family efflux transporter MFP subunit|nr:efflux RND transporter periplasmic adaptor subunit [Thermoguttaceae bacterium]